MAREIERLKALTVEKLKEPGMHADGGGLYLQVSPSESKSWIFRFQLRGKRREMGLGQWPTISLAKARAKADDCRKLLDAGKDPIKDKEEKKAEQRLAEAQGRTFQQCAEQYIIDNKSAWRNIKHAEQWESSLETYVYPIIGDLAIKSIDVDLVLKVLEQTEQDVGEIQFDFDGVKFWEARPETANRVRNRIERIMDWATARKYRSGENPARWRGHLESLLPKRSKLKGVKHFAALPYEEIGDFVQALQKQNGLGVKAFEFLILTAARTGEVLHARWNELDLAKKIWIIPAHRIKGGKEHRVPLTDRAIEILESLGKPEKPDDIVFHGQRKGKELSKMGLLVLLDDMKYRGKTTIHGFRSSFRDWCAEQTGFSREVAEMALAHSIGNAVEAAYRRGDLFEKRRKMMDAWAKHCATPTVKNSGNKVVKLRRKES